MGGFFDCYCAICGGPLNSNRAQIGSSSPSALARRHKLVSKTCAIIRRDEGRGLHTVDVEYEDEDKPGSDDDWCQEDEDCSYDPALVNQNTLRWLNDVVCLGYNPNILGSRKCVPCIRPLRSREPLLETQMLSSR